MKWQWALFLTALISGRLTAQELPSPATPSSAQGGAGPSELSTDPRSVVALPNPIPFTSGPAGGAVDPLTAAVRAIPCDDCSPGGRNRRDRLSGNHDFANFINWVGNPLNNIDPRAVTAIYPIFGYSQVSNSPPIPDADVQLYGPAISVALSDRLGFGLNQGGYVVAHTSRDPVKRQRLLMRDPLGRFRSVEAGGNRTGWLNLGGFVQYTLIANVERQFLLTAGLRWIAPAGSYEIFQGHGPLELAPYLTMGKEFGQFHVLATTGFQFPAGPGNDNLHAFYANVHFDRQCFGWLYPLVEFNTTTLTKSADVGLTTRRGFFDFGNFEATGTVVSMAAGANAVLIRERLELGAVYTTIISSQRDIKSNGLLVKMTLRY